ncbi:hypothetical protein [Natrarchaeobaculum sulfurireducens]|uniref:Uncharacterized protein n=1 Tax=Natrarchaeobaculum sulfurireducens TaxID=2044521 RepID=A0A346PAD6_9EURY|nr:hypothetical protein [Natrarchaeobaculum sulfurireducens]AXR76481.1 hypothetical protein AArc1_0128 [Natrarchaeobaculum sulfurireducens]
MVTTGRRPSTWDAKAYFATEETRNLELRFADSGVFRRGRRSTPSANFWAQYVSRGEPDDHPTAGLLLHFAYGIQAGALFGTLFALQDADRSIEPEQRGLLWGAVYGMVLSAFGSQIMLKEVLGTRLEADELALFHAGHLVYGLSLGAWVGSRTEGVEDPQKGYEYDDGN